MSEPTITINGTTLTDAGATTVRAAVEALARYIREDGLGDDEIGIAMAEGYRARIAELRRMFFLTPDRGRPPPMVYSNLELPVRTPASD